MAKEFRLSEDRLKELKEELDYLRTYREKEVAEQIKEARSFGDLSENSEYDEAKNEQGKLYSRIAELDNIISNAVIVDDLDDGSLVVHIGSRVKVRAVDSGDVEEYVIVGSQEADPMQGRISEDAPFGRALMGTSVGDAIRVDAPMGILKYELIEFD